MGLNILENRRRMIMAAQPHLETASGQSIEIVNGFPAPLASCAVTFGPAQAGSGDPSPSNIRELSGRTGLSVFVSPTSSGGTEYPVSWTDYGTVYGGTIDLVSGLLVVTYKAIILNADTPCESFRVQNSGKYTIWTGITGMASGTFASDDCVLADRAVKVAVSGDVGDATLGILIGYNSSAIYLYNMNTACGCTSTAQISEWLAQNPITCTVPLDNPVTYQLPASAVRTIRGENHIRSDAGSISAAYYTI